MEQLADQLTELSHDEAMTRIIHLLNKSGKVVAIGWEPACSIVNRVKASSQTMELMERLNALLCRIQFMRVPPAEPNGYRQAVKDIRESKEHEAVKNALRDLRVLMPVVHRGHGKGMHFPQSSLELREVPEQKRRRA